MNHMGSSSFLATALRRNNMIFSRFRFSVMPVEVAVLLLLGMTFMSYSFGDDSLPPAFAMDCTNVTGACEGKIELTLAGALRLALDHNRDLAVAAKEVGAQEGAALQAGLFKNPVLSAEAEDIHRPERNTTIRMSQLIELGGKRSARVAVATLARDAAIQDYEIKRRNIALGV